MILAATSVGELVRDAASRGVTGKVRRLFRNSAYLESKGELTLLLRGGLRSPMTVNVPEGPNFTDALVPNQQFRAESSEIRVGELTIRLSGATVFRSSLLSRMKIRPISGSEFVRGAAALKLLYSASEASLSLVNSRAFRAFTDSVLRPLSAGKTGPAHRLSNYLDLIGSGTGFTPAGDDFIAGFTAAFNFRARGTKEKQILFPIRELQRRTVAESASLVAYAQRGQVDEGLQNLIITGFDAKPAQFRAQLSELASRGHTSGLDMSLGVLTLLACLVDHAAHGRLLESALEVLLD